MSTRHDSSIRTTNRVARLFRWTPADATGLECFFNNMAGNSIGIVNDGAGTLQGTENWWGHASGPGGSGGRTNRDGKRVSKGNVNFANWLRRPIDLRSDGDTLTNSANEQPHGSLSPAMER